MKNTKKELNKKNNENKVIFIIGEMVIDILMCGTLLVLSEYDIKFVHRIQIEFNLPSLY